MFDEAFQFQDNHHVSKVKGHELEEVIEFENQRVPPLGACSNDSTDSQSYSSPGYILLFNDTEVYAHTFTLYTYITLQKLFSNKICFS